MGGAWCPKAQISSEVREYLEVDLGRDHLITKTETQGRFGNGQGQEYAESFLVEYWRDALGQWVVYKDSKGRQRDGPGRSLPAHDNREITSSLNSGRFRDPRGRTIFIVHLLSLSSGSRGRAQFEPEGSIPILPIAAYHSLRWSRSTRSRQINLNGIYPPSIWPASRTITSRNHKLTV
ncbi:unnamed protein product [Nezara viridula]|uniref:F5/8 type C domain-containing protein n=1 Tax=Nezara viridula TaxID=85310 RepID=A0A9P0H423_NEZVI|nr:unnamed protein product [Nezara viridula]